MSLLYFHITLISTAILLSFGMAFWGYGKYQTEPTTLLFITTAGSAMIGVLLGIYLSWFIRRIRSGKGPSR